MLEFAQRIRTMETSAGIVRGLFNGIVDPNTINFSAGAPANVTLPVEEVREISNEILRRDTRGIEALQYNNPRGIPELRKVVADYLLPRRGINVASPDDVMIVQGGLETLNLVCQLFINKGDVVLVEEPTFMHAIEIFEMFEAKCISVKCDEEGVVLEDLAAKQERYNAKMLYVIPSFQNPTGKTMSLARRKAVAKFGSEKNIVILEDDPYVELRYAGEDLPAIKAFDETGNVIFANSFSKIFSPGMRLGYVYAAPEVIFHIFDAKTATNSHTAVLNQILCAEFFNRGLYEKHIEEARAVYREKQTTAISLIKKYMPEGTKVTSPEGGLFVWVELPGDDIDTTELLKECAQIHVSFMAGAGFFAEEGKGRNCMRLSFSNLSEDKIEEGMKRLGDLIKSKM